MTLVACLPMPAVAEGPPVEIMLKTILDDARGYCVDVVGWQHRADPAKGLQAHTCYSYQNRIAVDQGFEDARPGLRVFRMQWFDLCMTLGGAHAGARLVLEPCDGRSGQQFEFRGDGRVTGVPETALCLTVADAPGRAGGGGDPPHLIRALTMEVCDPEKSHFQQWRARAATGG